MSLWNWLKNSQNRGALQFLVGVVAIFSAGLWTVFTYVDVEEQKAVKLSPDVAVLTGGAVNSEAGVNSNFYNQNQPTAKGEMISSQCVGAHAQLLSFLLREKGEWDSERPEHSLGSIASHLGESKLRIKTELTELAASGMVESRKAPFSDRLYWATPNGASKLERMECIN